MFFISSKKCQQVKSKPKITFPFSNEGSRRSSRWLQTINFSQIFQIPKFKKCVIFRKFGNKLTDFGTVLPPNFEGVESARQLKDYQDRVFPIGSHFISFPIWDFIS